MTINKPFIKLFYAACIVCAFLYIYFANALIEFNINISKYAELNVGKNKNWKAPVLKSIQTISNKLLPKLEMLSVDDVYQNWSADLPELTKLQSTFWVDSQETFLNAVSQARAGDIIEFAPIEIDISVGKIKFSHGGTYDLPIILRGVINKTIINLATAEGFYIDKPYWIVEGLTIKGMCDIDEKCNHAIHLVGNASNTIIRNNRFLNFNAHIKSNGNKEGYFPDNVMILNNEFRNEWIRYTNKPVVPIDVVGGKHWLVKNNFISDFGRKHKKNRNTTYGLYLKGGSTNGIITENIVACEWKVPHKNYIDTRIGISLGGGGTNKQYCVGKQCSFEHKDGVIEKNLVLNCKNDVALYINKAENSIVKDNVLLASLGIDVRFVESDVQVLGNTLTGRVKVRDGANIMKNNNVILKHFLDD